MLILHIAVCVTVLPNAFKLMAANSLPLILCIIKRLHTIFAPKRDPTDFCKHLFIQYVVNSGQA